MACPWAAARPRAVRAASFARRVASKPGQAPPPPTGTAADPSGALHTGGAWSLMCYWVRCFEARLGPVPRRVPHPQFRMQFPDTCSSSLSEKPGISTITFQSMKCAWGNCMRMCADRAPPPPTSTAAWSLYSLWASRGSRVLSFWGALVRVVTNVVNPRRFSCGFLIRCYKRRQSEGFFAENGGFWAQIDDVCNVGRPLVARPSPAATHGWRRLALSARWPGLKPPSPLRMPAEPRLKPPSPLRVRSGLFWCSFRAQRRCRFQRSLVEGEQWCCRFQSRHVVAPRARKSSPCVV